MDLTSLKTIKNLLKASQIRPSRGLGQNFFVDRGAVSKVIEAAELDSEDTVLEIGPGLGVLTQELAKRVKKVVAVEKDPKMIEILKGTLRDLNNIKIICGDIRRSDLHSNLRGSPTSQISDFKVVGNLPFYLTAPVIRRFLETIEARPRYMVLVVQKEVAQRICAKPPDMNLLAVSVQFYAEAKIISYIPKSSFWPSPEVNAAIIKIRSTKSEIRNLDISLFFKIAKAGFSQPRKQLANNLSKKLGIDKNKMGEWLLINNISPTRRAETLAIEEWVRLTNSLKPW